MMTLARTRDVLIVVDDQRGNPTSALDLADGLLAVVTRIAAGERTGLGETYHLAGTGAVSWCGFAKAVFDECARIGAPSARTDPIPTSAYPTRAARPANSMLECGKFANAFDYAMPGWQTSTAHVVERLAADARD